MNHLNARTDTIIQTRLENSNLSDKHWSNLNESIALIRKYFPRIDLYDSLLAGKRMRISFGVKSADNKKGSPLFCLDTKDGKALIRLRSIGSRSSGGGKTGKFLSEQIGEDWESLKEISIDIFNFEKSKNKFEKLLKHIQSLSDNKLIASRINGSARMPDDYTVDNDDEPTFSYGEKIAYLSSERRKEIEQKAIEHVINKYEKNGYDIEDCQAYNCGYDLLATKGSERLELEVKGTASNAPRFFRSRNEYKYAKQEKNEHWRLVVIYNIDKEPEELELTRRQMDEKFSMEELCWECTPKE